MRQPFFAGFLAALSALSCGNPVHTDAVQALGGEENGIQPGPRHRAGQPCLTCHGGAGPGAPDFVIGGTVYGVRNGTAALSTVSVEMTDSAGVTKTLVSNDVGNFYMPASEWDPAYPLSVKVVKGSVSKPMNSLIGRAGGCAFCHYGADNEPSHPPPVFLNDK